MPRVFRRESADSCRRPAGIRMLGDEIEEIADVDHALGIVQRLAIDRQARMAGGAEQVEQVAQRRVGRHRHDIGPRHHGVVDADAVEAEHVLQHRPFLGREIRILDGLREGVFEVVAEGFAGLQAEAGQNPVVPVVAQAFGLREGPEGAVVATSIFIHNV